MSQRILYVCLLLLTVPACATYRPKPLNTNPTLLNEVPPEVVTAGTMPLPELAGHTFNTDHGLDMTDVAILAVVNNQDLKVARDKQGLASAELLAAGVLPNPQLAAGVDHPTNGGPGYVNAWNIGLSYDIGALLMRNAAINASRADSLKVDLTVLWQEWQIVQQARLLFVDSMEQGKMMQDLKSYRDLLDARYQRERQALQKGDLTVDAVSADLTALQDANSSIHDLERQMSKTRHKLNALLNISPDVKLDLVGNIDLPEMAKEKVETYLSQLPDRRPDLMALQAGYKSQEERLRKAVLAQFPALTIGVTRARDTSGIYTSGIGITISLPFFDRNQGPIAVEKATRERLYDEYQARLNTAYSEVRNMLSQSGQVSRQYVEATNALPEMEQTAERANSALKAGNLAFTTYADLRAAILKKHLEVITLEQIMYKQRIALQTLLGVDLPGSLAAAVIQLREGGK